MSLEEFKQLTRSFMFPAIPGTNGNSTKVFERFIKGRVHPYYTFDEGFVAEYGRYALFLCPRVGCGFFEHKDVLAAFTLQLIHHVKRTNPPKATKTIALTYEAIEHYVRSLARPIPEWYVPFDPK